MATTTATPFYPASIVFRALIPEAYKGRLCMREEDEYMLGTDPRTTWGYRLFVRRGHEWEEHYNYRLLITMMLADNARLEAAFMTACEVIQEMGASVAEIGRARIRTDLSERMAHHARGQEHFWQEIERREKEKRKIEAERDQLATIAIENEQIERELIASAHLREPEASEWRKKLSNGLCEASNLARRMLGRPSIREENRDA